MRDEAKNLRNVVILRNLFIKLFQSKLSFC